MAGLYRRLSSRMKERAREQDLVREGVLALLHDRLYSACEALIQKGSCEVTEMKNLEYLYKTYHSLGGNGTGTEEFRLLNFQESSYLNEQGKKQPCYDMTRDGFVFLVMGYRGKKAARFKEVYIRRFNEMESFIRTLVDARIQFPLLTDNIKLLHENPRPYHFSNECDMLNRLVLGMTAKQFRETNQLGDVKSIRPYLSPEQINMLDILQKVDIGLLVSVPDFEQRKRFLEWYMQKVIEKQKKLTA